MTANEIKSKTCTHCKKELPVADFYLERHKNKNPRYSSWCKKCTIECANAHNKTLGQEERRKRRKASYYADRERKGLPKRRYVNYQDLKAKGCSRCKKELPVADFLLLHSKNRNPRYSSWCRKCSVQSASAHNKRLGKKVLRERARGYYHARRDEKVAHSREHARRFKQQCVDHKGGKCERCGYNKCLAALDFHHTNPAEKDFMITSKWVTFTERVRSELDKCILICSNCHKELHYNGAV